MNVTMNVTKLMEERVKAMIDRRTVCRVVQDGGWLIVVHPPTATKPKIPSIQ